jgi:hypothetical protein
MSKYLPGLLIVMAVSCSRPEEGALVGSWQSDLPDKPGLIRFETKKCFFFENGKLDIFAADYQVNELVLASMGQTVTWKVEQKDDLLTLRSTDGKLELRYRRLPETPPQLEIRPRQLPAAKLLPRDQLKDVIQDLAQRKKLDQAVRTDPAMAKQQPQVDADNYTYLLKLVDEVGWIDATRFGGEAAVAAFLIAQHSGDLGLLLAVLPIVEADAKAGRLTKSHYASMYDRTQVLQAERQRYGTQLGRNASGEMVVMPLQDRAKVDDFRKDLGLPPLADYLEQLRAKHGWTIRFADE